MYPPPNSKFWYIMWLFQTWAFICIWLDFGALFWPKWNGIYKYDVFKQMQKHTIIYFIYYVNYGQLYPWECIKLMKFTFFTDLMGKIQCLNIVPSYIWNIAIFGLNINRHTLKMYIYTKCKCRTHQIPRYDSYHLYPTYRLLSFRLDLKDCILYCEIK